MNKTETLTIRVTPVQLSVLRRLAASENRSMGNMIAVMMLEYMRNHPTVKPLPEVTGGQNEP